MPGLNEADLVWRVLTVDVVQHSEIIGLFTHGRIPGGDDFELVKECFRVTEETTPQLIVVNNPFVMLRERAPSSKILTQHEIFTQAASALLEKCIDRRLYHRMKERLHTFLFISPFLHNSLTEVPPEIAGPIQECFRALVMQRLKPADSFLVSVLTELRVSVLSSNRLKAQKKISPPSDFFRPSEVSLEATWEDPGFVKHSVDVILNEKIPERRRTNFIQFVKENCGSQAVLEEVVVELSKFHLEECGVRLFIFLHVDNSKQWLEMREELYPQYQEARGKLQKAIDDRDAAPDSLSTPSSSHEEPGQENFSSFFQALKDAGANSDSSSLITVAVQRDFREYVDKTFAFSFLSSVEPAHQTFFFLFFSFFSFSSQFQNQ